MSLSKWMKEEGKRSKSASPKVTPGPDANTATTDGSLGVKVEKRKQEEGGEDDLAKRAKIEGAIQAVAPLDSDSTPTVDTAPNEDSGMTAPAPAAPGIIESANTVEAMNVDNPAIHAVEGQIEPSSIIPTATIPNADQASSDEAAVKIDVAPKGDVVTTLPDTEVSQPLDPASAQSNDDEIVMDQS